MGRGLSTTGASQEGPASIFLCVRLWEWGVLPLNTPCLLLGVPTAEERVVGLLGDRGPHLELESRSVLDMVLSDFFLLLAQPLLISLQAEFTVN